MNLTQILTAMGATEIDMAEDHLKFNYDGTSVDISAFPTNDSAAYMVVDINNIAMNKED